MGVFQILKHNAHAPGSPGGSTRNDVANAGRLITLPRETPSKGGSIPRALQARVAEERVMRVYGSLCGGNKCFLKDYRLFLNDRLYFSYTLIDIFFLKKKVVCRI